MLREMASGKKAAFMRSLVGTVVEAITLQSGGAEFTEALTENYLKMKISGQHEANRWMDVKVEGVNGEMLVGTPVVENDREPVRGEQRWKRGAGSPPTVVTQECTETNKRIDL